MFLNSPIFMDDRKEAIHFIRDVLEMRRNVSSDADRLLAVAPSKLTDVGNGGVVQRPQSVFVESLDPFLEADLNAIRQ
jgi:hypothetical protein